MKFRRKSAAPEEGQQGSEPTAEPTTGPTTGPTTEPAPGAEPASGPFDVSEVEGDGVQRIDLGALLLQPEPGRDLRIQLDERTQDVQAVFLAAADGALELRAFAAPRNGDLWSTVRPQLAADMARRGGTATEREGRWGPELVCRLTVQREGGSTAEQPSRIIGVNGSRWLLRATLIGRPAMAPEEAQEWEDVISRVVVRRGEHAMPVGDALPMTMPPGVRAPDQSAE